MDTFQLKVFCSLARTRNYKKTADENNITQPAVSYQIKSLESELNVALLERNRYRTALTEAGREFLHYAELICEQEYLAKERMADIASGALGRITVAGIQTYLPQLSAAAADFLKEYPRVKLDTYILDGPDILRSHAFSEYDIYFCVDRMVSDNENYQNVKVKEEYMELYYSADMEDEIDLADWSTFRHIPFISIVETNYILYNRVTSIMKSMRYEPAHINHSTTIESILHLVNAGCGITILPANYHTGENYPNIRTKEVIHADSLLSLIISYNKKVHQPVIKAFMTVARNILPNLNYQRERR